MNLLQRLTSALRKPEHVTFCDACAHVCDSSCRQLARERDITLALYRAR